MPANLVNLEAVSKAHGTTTLLEAVSLGVADGDRIGVVGRNGGGKTTLISVLTRSEPTDAGRVTHTGGLRIAVLRQDGRLPPGATVREVVLGRAAEHEWAGDARVRAILDGLGLPGLGLDTDVGPMSGGERRRVLSRLCSLGTPTCWCSTSRRTTSMSRGSPGWPAIWSPDAARWSWSPTTAGSSTPSAPPPGR